MTVCILQCVSAAVGGFSGKFNCHRITQGPDYYQMVCDKQTHKLILLKYSLHLVLKCTRSGLLKNIGHGATIALGVSGLLHCLFNLTAGQLQFHNLDHLFLWSKCLYSSKMVQCISAMEQCLILQLLWLSLVQASCRVGALGTWQTVKSALCQPAMPSLLCQQYCAHNGKTLGSSFKDHFLVFQVIPRGEREILCDFS